MPRQPGRARETFRGLARRVSGHGALALLFAAPLLFIAVAAGNRGFTSPELQWIAQRASIVASGPGLRNLQYANPPLPVLLAVVLPGGTLSLAVCTCLFSGVMASILVRRIGLPRSVVLGLPLVLVPQMWYTASELLPQVLALTFLAVALFGFIQFATYGETYGGFIAGLALGISYAADPSALLYAAVMCLFVPFICAARYKGDRVATLGVWAVLVFPCVAIAVSWSFLIWRFSGTWPGNTAYAPNAHVLQFPLGVLGSLRHAFATAFEDLSRAVLYLTAAVLLCLRRGTRLIGLGLVLPALALTAALWLGFDYSSVTAHYLFVLLAITVITEHKLMDTPASAAVIAVAAVVSVVVTAKWLPPTTGYATWQHLMFQ